MRGIARVLKNHLVRIQDKLPQVLSGLRGVCASAAQYACVLLIVMMVSAVSVLPAVAQATPAEQQDAFRAGFQSAYSAYQAGQFADAEKQLQRLASMAPASFEVHELLGLTYAALSDNARAVKQLTLAAHLQPRSVAAINNLATSLVRGGKLAEAETQWRAALALEPQDYTANRNLARLYLQQGRLQSALPLLESARRIRPTAKDNNYDLALTYTLSNNLSAARNLIEGLLHEGDSGELHSLLGRVDEQGGKYIEAANEFELAAHMDPSEDTLFAWGSELLLHRAYEAAIQVFEQGTKRYPDSPRLWVGLGMSYYSRGEYEPSIRSLLSAADLNAQDPRCYLFLSKAYLSSPSQAEEVIERFRHYAELRPQDSMAQYYYAMSLWKGRRANATAIDYSAVEGLLQKAVRLDPKNAEAHLQLGILYSDQHQDAKALPEYQQALRLNPASADAHFRLARYYLRVGAKEKAQVELDRFKDLQAQHQAAVDKERAEVQQFVIATQPSTPTHP